MPTQTQDTTGVLTKQNVLYDAIMVQIEPDLTSGNYVETLELMKQESPAEQEARGKRYRKAFAECNKQIKQHMEWSKNMLQTAKKLVLKGKERASAKDEKSIMQSLEDSISHA